MNIVDPASRAWELMVKVCFQPFDFPKWLGLGFCAFLVSLAEGGANFQLPGGQNFPMPGSGSGQSIDQWFSDNLDMIIGVSILVGIIVIGLGLLVLWLASRGKFMLIDGIVHNRGLIKQPWADFKVEGNSLFAFRAILGFIAFLVIGGLAVGAGIFVYADLSGGGQPSNATIITMVAVGGVIFIAAVIIGIIAFILDDFVAPIMYMKRVRVREGWSIATGILAPQLGSVILYALFKILLGLGAVIVTMLAILLTCCLGALPYVNSVLTLPVTVFMMGYNLHFLQQFGPEFDIFKAPEVQAFA